MSPPTNAAAHRKHAQNRHALVDRCSTIRACEPCRRRKRLCNGQKPCSLCKAESNECVYSVISDHPRGVFTTNTARRLSSGSACETCRRRKTKCDGSNPCAFCAANNLKCINNAERRKRASISVGGASSSTLPSSTLSISSSLSPPTSSSSTLSTSSSQQQQQQQQQQKQQPSSLHSQSSSSSMGTAGSDHEAIDRIEDRLRRIEQLMTVFTPSPLSQSTVYASEDGSRRPYNSTNNNFNIPAHFVRQQRHSVQGITVAKEQMELQMARRAMSSSPPQFGHHSTSSDLLYAGAYITPPNSGGKKQRLQQQQQQHQQQQYQQYQQSTSSLSLSASPPSSPEPSVAAAAAAVTAGSATMLRQPSNPSSQPLTSSMLNLTLSPSSSTSSSSNTSSMQLPQSSMSTPLSDQQPQHHPHPQQHLYGSLGPSSHHQQHHQQLQRDHPITSTAAPPMPSLMDQLSKRTFAAGHSDYPVRSSYPIYPLSPSPPIQLPPTTTYAEASFSP